MDIHEAKVRMEQAAQKIRTPALREWTLDVLDKLPEDAWTREASLKYHHKDEQGNGGNILHELRTAIIADILAILYNLKPLDRDMVYSASLIHDCCRHNFDAKEKYTVKEHANLVRVFVEQNCEKSVWTDPICTLIETHMSRWGVPPYQPEIALRDIVVIADFLASQPNLEVS